MTRAFIVQLDLDALDELTLIATADDISATLEEAGFAVEQVAPWATHDGPHSSLMAGPAPLDGPPTPFDTLG